MNPQIESVDRGRDRSLLTLAVKEEAQRLGFALVGVSPVHPTPHERTFAEWLRKGLGGELGYLQRTEELRRDPRKLVPWANSVISVGMNYYHPLTRPSLPEAGRGWISRYAWGDDYHDLMRRKLDALLKKIEEIFSAPMTGKAFVDSGPVLERDLASVSGIGWIGKNTHLISPQLGSWFFLGELFVSIDLVYDRPIRDRCGQCDLCLKACPTAAFAGPYQLDARRCISYLTIELKGAIPLHLRSLIGNHVFGCDICQEICPYNVKARATAEEAFSPREGLYMPELVSFLSLSDEEFQARFRGSPVLRAKRRGFLRNVAVALGNLKDRSAVPHLAEALQDYEPLVRGHVAWALGELGGSQALGKLEARQKVETNPGVIEEIRAALGRKEEPLRFRN